jgi:UDP-N-acetyl-D-mannosaminuronic acid dehydrogenase
MSLERISVIGLGYIGLPTAAMFAANNVEVIGIDRDEDVVQTINQGEIHIIEPDLDLVVKDVVANNMLSASLSPEKADAFIIAVPTPFKGDKKPDLSYVESAAIAIAPQLEKGNLIILESTSPVGTTEKLASWIARQRPDLLVAGNDTGDIDVHIAYCPERVLPGQIMKELIDNDRIVGGLTQSCAQQAISLYKKFVKGECIETNARTAEMAKLTENSFRDVNIAFANELSLICDELNIDVWELIRLANRHPRVNVLKPGCGVGGHCIAVDPWFIVDSCPTHSKLIKEARLINDEKPNWVINKIKAKIAQGSLTSVVCLGIAFKPDIDDLRESPAMNICYQLANLGLSVKIIEPNINVLPTRLEIAGCELITMDQLASHTDAVKACFVSHTVFKDYLSETPIILNQWLDFCGVFKP